MIIIMDSIHHILKAEKLFKKMGVDIELIPVPKDIHSNCGSAIKIDAEKKDLIVKILKEKNFNFKLYTYNRDINFYIEEEL